MKLKCVISAIFLMLCFAGQVAAGALDDGLVALRDGNFATALRLLRPLAEQGDAGAQFNLGRMYTSGQGVPQDYAAAAVWYRKAADQGYVDAQYNLGNMYFDGQGVPQNYAAAASWFHKAADQGDNYAQTNLGGMYYLGLGVQMNLVAAHMWFDLATLQGNQDALSFRDLTEQRMTPAQITEAQKLAREWKPTPER